MRIAHVSDLHVMSPGGVRWRSLLFNKRLTGYANLVLHRARVFRRDYLAAVLAAAAADSDHVVVTGDITNLSLETEYEEAVRLIEGMGRKTEVTVVPGNHDIYLPHVQREGRFPRYLSPFFTSDLPELAQELPAGHFPCVKLRGPAAIIGLSSAVPRPAFVSAGRLGRPQLEALKRVLTHPEVARRTPVVLVHHDPMGARYRLEQLRSGLTDATAFRDEFRHVGRGLILFGHLHVRKRTAFRTRDGEIDVVSASGAALDHPSTMIRAGYNVYEIAADGAIASVYARVLDPTGSGFRTVEMPRST